MAALMATLEGALEAASAIELVTVMLAAWGTVSGAAEVGLATVAGGAPATGLGEPCCSNEGGEGGR